MHELESDSLQTNLVLVHKHIYFSFKIWNILTAFYNEIQIIFNLIQLFAEYNLECRQIYTSFFFSFLARYNDHHNVCPCTRKNY